MWQGDTYLFRRASVVLPQACITQETKVLQCLRTFRFLNIARASVVLILEFGSTLTVLLWRRMQAQEWRTAGVEPGQGEATGDEAEVLWPDRPRPAVEDERTGAARVLRALRRGPYGPGRTILSRWRRMVSGLLNAPLIWQGGPAAEPWWRTGSLKFDEDWGIIDLCNPVFGLDLIVLSAWWFCRSLGFMISVRNFWIFVLS